MRILITNHRPDLRGGSESFVRDLARSLQARGHSVLAYTSDECQRERLLETDVIPVATDLENLPILPDVIHARHHLDAMTALASLPGVPALFHCEGDADSESAPWHPRIYHYLAPSKTEAQHLMAEYQLPPGDVSVFPTPVDLARFGQVRKLPARPARALFFAGRHDGDGALVSAIQEATSRCGLVLDFLDGDFDRMVDAAEKLLPDYDVVFASGRSAVEALASGCAVVILGAASCGEMVQPENFDRLRESHFSIADEDSRPLVERITGELQRYTAESCGAVSERLRREADFELARRALETLYEQVIARHQRTAVDIPAESRAVSRYLRKMVSRISETDLALGRKWSSVARPASFAELSARVALIEGRHGGKPA